MNGNYKVLLVEDLDDDIFLFKKALGALPAFELVGCAQTGDQAIDYLKGEGEYADREKFPWPDIMVLDLKLPGKDGFQVLEWLKKQPRRPKVGFFTSSSLTEDRREAGRLGAELYQVKTYEPEEFARFMYWLSRLVDEDQTGGDKFKATLLGIFIATLLRCA